MLESALTDESDDAAKYLQRAEALEREAAATNLPNARAVALAGAAKWRQIADTAEWIEEGARAREAATRTVETETPDSSLPPESMLKMHKHSWTDADIATLKAMADAGASYHQIARKLGRTSEAVKAKAKAVGVRSSSRPEGPALICGREMMG